MGGKQTSTQQLVSGLPTNLLNLTPFGQCDRGTNHAILIQINMESGKPVHPVFPLNAGNPAKQSDSHETTLGDAPAGSDPTLHSGPQTVSYTSRTRQPQSTPATESNTFA